MFLNCTPVRTHNAWYTFCVLLGTSGAPFMDCIVCDHTACDPASADVQFTEAVLYLPEPYFMAPTDVDSEDTSTGMWAPLHSVVLVVVLRTYSCTTRPCHNSITDMYTGTFPK